MQPSLAELTSRFLSQPREAVLGDVEAYDVVSAFRVEPQAAWSETLEVLKAFVKPGSLPKMPAEWSGFVREAAPARFIPMAFGYYPQQVSELTTLIASETRSAPAVPSGIKSALLLAAKDHPDATLNERAAEAWRVGETDTAIAIWESMSESVVKAFNLGVAALVGNQLGEAKSQLTTAISRLPEENGWRSLAELYIALAESNFSVLGSKTQI